MRIQLMWISLACWALGLTAGETGLPLPWAATVMATGCIVGVVAIVPLRLGLTMLGAFALYAFVMFNMGLAGL